MNDLAACLRRQLTDIAASQDGKIDLETLSAQQTGACKSCVQLLTKVKLFETNTMTAREESDLNRERNSGRRYAENISRCYGHAGQMLATEKQVADLQRQLMQEKARTANLPPDTTTAHVGTEPTAAPGPEADGTDAPAGIDTSEVPDEDATGGDWPDSGTEGASGVDDPTSVMLEEEIASRGLARRPLNEDNEDQPQAKRPRQRESAAASRDPTTAEDPASASRTGGSRATSAATELRTIRVTGNDNIITRAGVSIHRRDDDWLTELLSTLRDAASKYTPDKVDKVFNVMPDWRYDDHGVLLPH